MRRLETENSLPRLRHRLHHLEGLTSRSRLAFYFFVKSVVIVRENGWLQADSNWKEKGVMAEGRTSQL